MNRAERRQYSKEMKHDDTASRCPICRAISRHICIPSKNNTCDIVCECSGTVAMRNVEGMIPMTYVRLDLMEGKPDA